MFSEKSTKTVMEYTREDELFDRVVDEDEESNRKDGKVPILSGC